MEKYNIKSMDDLVSSISSIGETSKELEFKSKKIVEALKKKRNELMQETYDNAFNIDIEQ